MTYTAAAVVAVLLALLTDHLLGSRLVRRRTWWLAYAIVVFFQLLTNGWLTGRGIVRYDPHAILGSARMVFVGDWRLAFAPVEDLAFGFALVLTTCAAWTQAGPRRSNPSPRPNLS